MKEEEFVQLVKAKAEAGQNVEELVAFLNPCAFYHYY
jgi:hypothetical protein